jgi:alcohol dehydrogenase class IV
MVKPFQFSRLPVIYFGTGKLKELTAIIKTYGNSVMLITGKSSFISSPYCEELLRAFKRSYISYFHVVIEGEPSVEDIDDAVSQYRNENIRVVAAIGGGSVIDAGKAISAMMYKSESVFNFIEVVGKKDHPGTKIPFIAIPTTSGTGSEATKNAVISGVGKNGFKRSLRHENLVPDIALVDPELTLNCPAEITAASGMDCFTQLTEAYLSTKANPYTDALALAGLKSLKASLKESYLNGENIAARTGMSFAALTSGICLANAGLGAVHGFASSIGGMYSIPHGLVCGTLMAAANEINVRELRITEPDSEALKKYAYLGKLFIDSAEKSDDFYIDGFIEYLHNLSHELNLPRLGSYGLKREDAEAICSKTEIKNNPVKLTTDNLIEILNKRL